MSMEQLDPAAPAAEAVIQESAEELAQPAQPDNEEVTRGFYTYIPGGEVKPDETNFTTITKQELHDGTPIRMSITAYCALYFVHNNAAGKDGWLRPEEDATQGVASSLVVPVDGSSHAAKTALELCEEQGLIEVSYPDKNPDLKKGKPANNVRLTETGQRAVADLAPLFESIVVKADLAKKYETVQLMLAELMHMYGIIGQQPPAVLIEMQDSTVSLPVADAAFKKITRRLQDRQEELFPVIDQFVERERLKETEQDEGRAIFGIAA